MGLADRDYMRREGAVHRRPPAVRVPWHSRFLFLLWRIARFFRLTDRRT